MFASQNVIARQNVRRSLTTLLVVVALASVAIAQDAADLRVTPLAEAATIGKDVVLEIALPASVGTDASALTATIAAADGSQLFEGAVRLASAGTAGKFTLTATSRPSAPPGTHELAVNVARGTQQYSWTGPIELSFGDEWTAARITYFIENRGLILFLGLVFLGGILMSATPCIYPMIPITLAVLGAQTQEKSVAKGFILASFYGLGLAFVYGIIGVVSATVFSGVTAFLQSPAVLVPIAILMTAMAFAMFGAFELEAPAFLRNRLQGSGGGRAGVFGAFIAGMVAGLVASPCVGPFVAALLVWVGTTGSVFLGFWSLFVFGLGLSALLVAVGTFPSFMNSMPQSGGWMESVKKGMGLLLLFMAFFFVRPPLVLPESIFYPLLGGVVILVAVFMGAFDKMTAETHWWDRARKGLGIIFLLTGIWLLGRQALPSMLPAPTIAQPTMIAAQSAGGPQVAAAPLPAKVPWQVIHTGENVQDFIDSQIEVAKASGKPMIIDFWATWCAYCKKLDKKVWNQPEIVQESLRYVTVKVDATKTDDDDMTAVKELFRVPGLPTVAFIDSQGNILYGKTFNGYKGPDEILALMKSVE